MRHIINQLMFPVWVTRSHSEAADLMKTKVLIYQYINISIYQYINVSIYQETLFWIEDMWLQTM